MTKKAAQTPKVVYGVVILRRTQNHITIMESNNFDACLAKWEELHVQWTECAKEGKPFLVKDPIITAFEPGLIYEIALAPLVTEEIAARSNSNPYYKNMVENGFGASMEGQDLLSRMGQR